MPWYAWLVLASLVGRAAAGIIAIGRPIMVTPMGALQNCVGLGLMAWAVVALAT
jgi:hypothetical protein